MRARWDSARIISLVLTSSALLGGSLSFFGWVAGNDRLIDWWQTGITIKANTAFCLTLLGTAVMLQWWLPAWRHAVQGLAALVGLIGLATLSQHVTGIGLGIDTLLFDELPGSPATAAPGRMGPPASSSFIFLASTLWLVSRGSRSRISVALPLLSLVASSLSMIGYAYGAEVMYTAPRLTGISVQTATMLAMLAGALLFLQPQRQPMSTLLEDSTVGELARRMIPLAVLLPVMLGWLRVGGQRAGWFDMAFGTALRTSVEIILLVWMLWWSLQLARARDRQRHEAEQAKYRGESRLRRVLDASPLPYMVLAPVHDREQAIVDFRWTYVNAAAARVFGRDPHTLVDAPVSTVFPETWNEPGLFEHFLAAARRHEIRDFEVRSFVGGLQGWFQVVVYSLDQEIGVWFSDVSERKQQEAELRHADQRKDEFLATLAHELRNPLAPIRMAATLAKKPHVSDAQRQWCNDVVERQVQHMSLLLDDLLDVSRITRGVLELRQKPVSLSALVQSAVETSRPLIDGKKHQLHLDLPVDAVINVDPLRMAQIVANLLNNAAKYTAPGGTIRLSAGVAGDDLRISVSDSGVGIAREHLDAIFDMFAQVRSSQDHSEGGLGIGLALTRGLVELHRGRLSVHSEGVGQGSTFTLHIPQARIEAPSVAQAAAGSGGHARRLHILIADDNRDAATSLGILLRVDGHEVTLASDGEEAVARFRTQVPDVALLDIGMPRMSGLEVARQIRAVDSVVVLIAITGWGQAEDRARSAAAGFDHHLTKPVDYASLVELLAPVMPRTDAAAGLRGNAAS